MLAKVLGGIKRVTVTLLLQLRARSPRGNEERKRRPGHAQESSTREEAAHNGLGSGGPGS
jgi:hypothetical protein